MELPHWLTTHPAFWYHFFSILPVYLVPLAMLWVGYKRNYPFLPYVLILGMGRIGFVVGTWISANQWGGQVSGRSTLLALFVAAFAVWSTVRLLKFKHPVLDLYALFVPLALALQRMGCLSVGCCFGNPTDLPWGISYGEYAPVTVVQKSVVMLEAHVHHSLSVHPFPLYLIVGYLLAQVVLLVMARKTKQSGSLALLALSLLSGVRFVAEFFRDAHSNLSFAQEIAGLKQLQWIMLLATLGFAGAYWWRERKKSVEIIKQDFPAVPSQALLLLAILEFGFLATSHPLLNTQEWFSLVPLQLALGGLLLANGEITRVYKFVVVSLLGVGLALAATNPNGETPDSEENGVKLGLGIDVASFMYPTEYYEGCMGGSYENFRKNWAFSPTLYAKYSAENPDGIRSYLDFGGNLVLGRFFEKDHSTPWVGTDINLNLVYGYFGLGSGLRATTKPESSAYNFHLMESRIQLGNFREWYVAVGTSPYFNSFDENNLFAGVGGRTKSRRISWEAGILPEAVYGVLDYRLSQGLHLNADGCFFYDQSPDDIGSSELRLYLLWTM